MNFHTTHPAAWDARCLVCTNLPRWGVTPGRMPPRTETPELPTQTYTWNLALHTTPIEIPGNPPNPDPLRAPETDDETSCCELACYEDPGCTCDGCGGSVDDEDRGVWVGLVLMLVALLVGVGVGVLIGRVTA